MLRRDNPDAPPGAVFTDLELEFLDSSAPNAERGAALNLDFYMIRVARLGDYLARRRDAPPGTIILWRGFARLADLVAGFTAARMQQTTICG